MHFSKILLAPMASLLVLMSASSYANLPFHPIKLPRDDAAHYDNVPYPVHNLSEWWYYNGKLTAQNGQQFGYYLVVYRMQLYKNGKKFVLPFAQFQLTNINLRKVTAWSTLFFTPKSTQYSTTHLTIKLKNNYIISKKDGHYFLHANLKSSGEPAIKLNLELTPARKPLLINKNGLLPMGNHTNSYYYSITRLKTAGTLSVNNKIYHFNPKKSSSWMDHQWGDFVLTLKSQWMWMGIRLNNGTDINLTNAVNASTKQTVGGLVNVLLPNGKTFYTTHYKISTAKQQKQGKYPLQYTVSIPPLKLSFTANAMAPDQDKNGFWEGISHVSGTDNGKPVSGFAYTENTIRD